MKLVIIMLSAESYSTHNTGYCKQIVIKNFVASVNLKQSYHSMWPSKCWKM